MVDFQSRDRRRDGRDTDDETAPDEEQDTTDDEPAIADADDAEFGAETLPFAVVTVTGKRSIAEDATGDAVVAAIEAAGDAVATRELVGPSYDGVQGTLGTLVERADVEAVVTVGGTGVEPKDVTIDAAADIFDKQLPGFGELFRERRHEQVGTATIRTRTTAGIVDGVPVFCLPGETAAARLGVEDIVLEEVASLADAAGDTDS